MKNLICLLALLGLLFVCNVLEVIENEIVIESEFVMEMLDYQFIDIDEVLMAIVLMVVFEVSWEGVKVIGYNMVGEFVIFKEGINEFICLVDNFKQEGFNVVCYYWSLEFFMVCGCEFCVEGKNVNEIFDICEEEVKAGKLDMGEIGVILYIYYGLEVQYDLVMGEVDQVQYCYVVYMFFVIVVFIGLLECFVEFYYFWIMNLGMYWVYIMIIFLMEGE